MSYISLQGTKLVHVQSFDQVIKINTKYGISNVLLISERIFVIERSSISILLIYDSFNGLLLTQYQLPFCSWAQFVQDEKNLCALLYDDKQLHVIQIFSDNSINHKTIEFELNDQNTIQATMRYDGVFILNNLNEIIILDFEALTAKRLFGDFSFVLNLNKMILVNKQQYIDEELKLCQVEHPELLNYYVFLSKLTIELDSSEIVFSFQDELVLRTQNLLSKMFCYFDQKRNYYNQWLNYSIEKDKLCMQVQHKNKTQTYYLPIPKDFVQITQFLQLNRYLCIGVHSQTLLQFHVIEINTSKSIRIYEMNLNEVEVDLNSFMIRHSNFIAPSHIPPEELFSIIFYDQLQQITYFVYQGEVFFQESGIVNDCRIYCQYGNRQICQMQGKLITFINVNQDLKTSVYLQELPESFFQISVNQYLIFAQFKLYVMVYNANDNIAVLLQLDNTIPSQVFSCSYNYHSREILLDLNNRDAKITQGYLLELVEFVYQCCEELEFVFIPNIPDTQFQNFVLFLLENSDKRKLVAQQFCLQEFNLSSLQILIEDRDSTVEHQRMLSNILLKYLQTANFNQIFYLLTVIADMQSELISKQDSSLHEQLKQISLGSNENVCSFGFLFSVIYILLKNNSSIEIIMLYFIKLGLSSQNIQLLLENTAIHLQDDHSLIYYNNKFVDFGTTVKTKIQNSIKLYFNGFFDLQLFNENLNQFYNQNPIIYDYYENPTSKISVQSEQSLKLIRNETNDLRSRANSLSLVSLQNNSEPDFGEARSTTLSRLQSRPRCDSRSVFMFVIPENSLEPVLDFPSPQPISSKNTKHSQTQLIESEKEPSILQTAQNSRFSQLPQLIHLLKTDQFIQMQELIKTTASIEGASKQLLYIQLKIVNTSMQYIESKPLLYARYYCMIFGLLNSFASAENYNRLFTILLINKHLLKSSDIMFQDLETKSIYELQAALDFMRPQLISEYEKCIFMKCETCKGNFNLLAGRCLGCGILLKVCLIKLKPVWKYLSCTGCSAVYSDLSLQQCLFCGIKL